MKYLLYLLAILFVNDVLAQNIHGAYIQQESSDVSIDIQYFVIASPTDSALTSSIIHAEISCNTFKKSVVLTGLNLTSKSRIGENCDKDSQLWLYVFSKSVDLKSSVYADIVSCCDVRLSATIANRNSMVNTITTTSPQTMFVYTDIKGCTGLKNRSSVSFPILISNMVCLNTASWIQLGASETSEYDSIGYEFVTPLINDSQSVKLNSGIYPDLPLKLYNPTGKPYPYNNPNSNPPIGFNVNYSTGVISFTPEKGKQIGLLAIKISEWRKNTSGKYEKIGETLIESSLIVNMCNGNNPPVIDGPFTYGVCEGEQICFNISTFDKLKVPPPPAVPPLPDTVSIKWNRGIPGASFSVINPNALHQTGRFCWKPELGMSNSLPYSFALTARDNSCPVNGTVTRAYHIKVLPTAQAKTSLTHLGGNKFEVILVNNGNPKSSVQFTLLDSDGKTIPDTSLGYFHSTFGTTSNTSPDNITIIGTGIFIIQSEITDSANCPKTLFDTLSNYSISVPDHKQMPLRIFPNPAHNEVNLSFECSKIEIYSLNGNKSLEFTDSKKLNIKSLSSGVYFIHAENKGVLYHAKLIVE